MSNTRELLADYAALLNEHGVDSREADQFLRDNQFNEEFVELANLSRTLKKALTLPTRDLNENRCGFRE